jgi:hypothetical protein
MLRSRSHQNTDQRHQASRPFFAQGARSQAANPFFQSPRSNMVQRMAEPTSMPEEEESPVQMQAEETTLQRETIMEEEEEVAQPATIQRKCAACATEQDQTTLQPKLTVGQPNDQYEQEADQVADQVVSSLQTPQDSSVQPKQATTPSITPLVMRQGEGKATAHLHTAQQIQQTRGSGHPLDRSIRGSMEKAFGADFSGVRIHAGSQANRLNRSLNARAFTTGQDIYFKQGEYQPGSQSGQKLLAHELTHVVQQQGSSTMIARQTMPPPNPMDDPRMHPSGAPNAASCAAPSGCPPHFCEPYDSESYARHQRTQMLPTLMVGIAAAVGRRVVPLWHEYLLGGSAPKNLTSDFGSDFAASPTTADTSIYLMNALQTAIASSPFVVPASSTTTDMTAWVSSEVAAINTPGDTHEMNFNVPSDIAGNLAGGIGANQTACQSGAQPSPFNDQRLATVGIEFTPNPDGTVTAQPVIHYTVKDTIDLCPGNCGTELEQLATVPMSQFEATGISGDIPFTVNFVHRPPSFQV